MAEDVKLSGHVICQNNAATIERCLKSLSFCDEVVVIDGFSTDGTFEKAKELATTVEQRRFDGFGAQRARAWDLSRGEWIFWLDSDEEASAELGREIRGLLERDAGLPDAFLVRRRFHYPPAWGVRGRYWQSSIRLFRRSAGRWDPAKTVHEALEIPGARGKLAGVIEHWPWTGLDDLIPRAGGYAARAAREHVERGGRGGAVRAVSHAFFRFLRHYLRDGGWRRGTAGFFFSAGLALEPFLKYARAWEIERLRERAGDKEQKKQEQGPERKESGEAGEKTRPESDLRADDPPRENTSGGTGKDGTP